jgi:hypothetical protein
VKVRLERDNLGVLVQHCVGMEFLIGQIRLYVDVDAVAETGASSRISRLVAFRKKLEPEFKMPAGLPAIRVKMGCSEMQS